MRELNYLDLPSLSQTEKLWAYNGLDTSVTREIWDAVTPMMDDVAWNTYRFSKRMLGPAFDMMYRGIRVDPLRRGTAIESLGKDTERYQEYLSQLAHAAWRKPLNPNSPKQLKEFFYEFQALPIQYKFEKGVRKPSCGREQLEKLGHYYYAEPFCNLILFLRDLGKQLGFIRTAIDSDGRMRCTYSVGGTETGRWSSYASGYDTGTNLQNVNERLRDMFIADPGMKLCYLDLQQAESRVVGGLSYAITGQRNYLDACESGDLHTTSAKLIWPGLNWTGDLGADKANAERPFYRYFSYRDMSKRGGHGTNYYGKPYTMARHLKVPKRLMEDFQLAYFSSFPEIPLWHQWTATELHLHQQLTGAFGRRRFFFGRPTDDTTLREAIAFYPQNYVGECLNIGMDQLYRSGLNVQLLAQIHDAILFQYPEKQEAEVLSQVPSIISVTQRISGRKASVDLTIPCDMMIGWNFRKYSTKPGLNYNTNPDSLMPYNPARPDTRTRQYDPSRDMTRLLLDRVL
jgi:DNA polymerase I-like protein with 3'-5' exonuclease and polymerase domains